MLLRCLLLRVACAYLQGTAGPGSGAAPQSALQGISGIKVDPKDFEETTKRCAAHVAGGWLRHGAAQGWLLPLSSGCIDSCLVSPICHTQDLAKKTLVHQFIQLVVVTVVMRLAGCPAYTHIPQMFCMGAVRIELTTLGYPTA